MAGVSITEGSTALTRIRSPRSSSASSWASRTTAALLVACATGAGPVTAVFDPTSTIAPPPRAASRGAAACAVHSAEPKLELNRLVELLLVDVGQLARGEPAGQPDQRGRGHRQRVDRGERGVHGGPVGQLHRHRVHPGLGAEPVQPLARPVQGDHRPPGGQELRDDRVPEGAGRAGHDHCWVHPDILPARVRACSRGWRGPGSGPRAGGTRRGAARSTRRGWRSGGSWSTCPGGCPASRSTARSTRCSGRRATGPGRPRRPTDFVFAVKGGRFITHLKQLREVETPLANFFASGVLALGAKLGPLLWQLPPRMRFDADRLAAFLDAAARARPGPRPGWPPGTTSGSTGAR